MASAAFQHHSSEGKKAKRRSSPFLRLVHRISMNRKTGRKDGSRSVTHKLDSEGSAGEVHLCCSNILCHQQYKWLRFCIVILEPYGHYC